MNEKYIVTVKEQYGEDTHVYAATTEEKAKQKLEQLWTEDMKVETMESGRKIDYKSSYCDVQDGLAELFYEHERESIEYEVKTLYEDKIENKKYNNSLIFKEKEYAVNIIFKNIAYKDKNISNAKLILVTDTFILVRHEVGNKEDKMAVKGLNNNVEQMTKINIYDIISIDGVKDDRKLCEVKQGMSSFGYSYGETHTQYGGVIMDATILPDNVYFEVANGLYLAYITSNENGDRIIYTGVNKDDKSSYIAKCIMKNGKEYDAAIDKIIVNDKIFSPYYCRMSDLVNALKEKKEE